MQLNKRMTPETIHYLQVFIVTRHSCFCPPGEQLLCSVHMQHATTSMSYGRHITMAAAKQTSDVVMTISKLNDGENDIGM